MVPFLSPQQIRLAAEAIRRGGIVLYPTDTAYALGCDFKNVEAIERILHIKKRTNRRFTLIGASQQHVEQFFPLTPCQRKLARAHWPGPLSLVVHQQFAVRVPDEPHARKLAERANTLLIATSANISGEEELYALESEGQPHRTATLHHLRTHVDGILDIGELPHRLPSTVVECHDNQTMIHRQGPVIIPKKLI